MFERKIMKGLGMLSQELFWKLLRVERKRTERSGRGFVLMLANPGNRLRPQVLSRLILAIGRSIRDTDLAGWYKEGAIIGVIFTELRTGQDKCVVQEIATRVTTSLYGALTIGEVNEIQLSFHVFPEDWNEKEQGGPLASMLQIELAREYGAAKNMSLFVKRLVDIVGSLACITLCLPLMTLIGLTIKLTSRGPVVFRQVRLGQWGERFTCLKFRSMFVNSDEKVHEAYVDKFIRGTPNPEQGGANEPKFYKLTGDRRITPFGRVLRITSLDEVPQLINVLAGKMSLVGPRPAVGYEVARYQLWHKQRLLAMKPGITGLWQVAGRSRLKFDDMVRLDIQYGRSWSLWLDIKILLRTPRAVLSGVGAR